MASDYYKTLGVSKNASQTEINAAYKKLAKKYHPDLNPDKNTEDKIKEINEAYEILKDQQKRAKYDQMGHSGFNSYQSSGGGQSHWQYTSSSRSGNPFESIFDFFGEDFMGNTSSTAKKKSFVKHGATVRYDIKISLEEAFLGVEKEISFACNAECEECDNTGNASKKIQVCQACRGSGVVEQRSGFFSIAVNCNHCHGKGYIIPDPCNVCNGSGVVKRNTRLKIKIPPGIQNTNIMNIPKKGESGVRGGQKGDLHMVVHVLPSAAFKVDGVDLETTIDVHYSVAVLGGEIFFKSIGNETIDLKIDPSTKNNTKIVVKGKGMPSIKTSKRGNLTVNIGIDVPKTVSAKEKSLISELKQIQLNMQDKSDKSFFSKIKELW